MSKENTIKAIISMLESLYQEGVSEGLEEARKIIARK